MNFYRFFSFFRDSGTMEWLGWTESFNFFLLRFSQELWCNKCVYFFNPDSNLPYSFSSQLEPVELQRVGRRQGEAVGADAARDAVLPPPQAAVAQADQGNRYIGNDKIALESNLNSHQNPRTNLGRKARSHIFYPNPMYTVFMGKRWIRLSQDNN